MKVIVERVDFTLILLGVLGNDQVRDADTVQTVFEAVIADLFLNRTGLHTLGPDRPDFFGWFRRTTVIKDQPRS